MTSNKKDSLGDRMKEYERCYSQKLTKNNDYIIRLDGRHFHSLTKGMQKPFDRWFIGVMKETAKALLKEIQGAQLVYVQSDEISIYMTDKHSITAEPWFDNKLQKIVSVSASFCTMKFNEFMKLSGRGEKQGMFDSRIFAIPESDIPNYFIWRQRDWQRNSVQMLGRSRYSSKELHKKSCTEIKTMLDSIDLSWDVLNQDLKNGSFFIKKEREIIEVNDSFDYDSFNCFLSKDL